MSMMTVRARLPFFWLLSICVLPSPLVLADWSSPEAALKDLWDKKGEVSKGSGFGPKIYQVSIDTLPQGLKLQIISLFRYPLHVEEPLTFLPGDDEFYSLIKHEENWSSGLGGGKFLATNERQNLWADYFRTEYTNPNHNLAELDLKEVTGSSRENWINKESALKCPPMQLVAAKSGPKEKKEYIRALMDSKDTLTNQQRLYCFSKVFRAGKHANISETGKARKLSGYLEVTHALSWDDKGMDWAVNTGRILWDFINNRVYYTPIHYGFWKESTKEGIKRLESSIKLKQWGSDLRSGFFEVIP